MDQIRALLEANQVALPSMEGNRFPVSNSRIALARLAAVDEAHNNPMSGGASSKNLERGLGEYGKSRFRLANGDAHIRGFPSDNGREFINHNVEKMLDGYGADETKSRPRRSNDYLHFHRPCEQAEVKTDAKGKPRLVYAQWETRWSRAPKNRCIRSAYNQKDWIC